MRYDKHPTQYAGLSNEQLYGMYRQSKFETLSEDQKRDLIQETVNRDALERGEIGSPEVKITDMPSDVCGDSAHGIININRNLTNGIQSVEYNGKTITHTVPDYNMQVFNTAIHENVHAWQDQITDGTIKIEDSRLADEYKSNNFTSSVVKMDGVYSLGSQYMTGETANGYFFYYFQSSERDANRFAEEKTVSVMNELADRYGNESSFDAYNKSIEVNGYRATENEAIKMFENPNFEVDLNQTLLNHYYETNVSVDSNTETAVKAEMLASFNGLHPGYYANNEINNQSEAMSQTDERCEVTNVYESMDDGLDM